MKKKTETTLPLEEIIRYYGSLEAYNEEQRRCGLATIETTLQANPFAEHVTINNALPVEEQEIKPEPRRFWLNLFGQKA
jgi:hypothetical protein